MIAIYPLGIYIHSLNIRAQNSTYSVVDTFLSFRVDFFCSFLIDIISLVKHCKIYRYNRSQMFIALKSSKSLVTRYSRKISYRTVWYEVWLGIFTKQVHRMTN